MSGRRDLPRPHGRGAPIVSEIVDALRPLSLDQFAAMTAEMEAGFARDRVLEAASVSQEQWDLTQETWLLRMAKQGQQRKLALLDRYNELLAKHRKAAQRKMRAEKRKLKGPMPVAPEAHLSPILRPRLDDGGATFQKPSFSDAGAPFVAQVEPAAAPAWAPPGGVVVPVVPSVITAPPVVAAPPIQAVAPTPDDDDDDVGVTAIAAAIAPTGPAWLAASVTQAKPEPSTEITATGERSPLAGAAPAWLKNAKAPSAKRGATLNTEMGSSSPWATKPSGDGAAKADGLPFQRAGGAAAPAAAPATPAGGLPFQRAQAPAPQAATAPDPLPFQRPQAPAPQVVPQAVAAPDPLPFQRPQGASPSQPGLSAVDALPFQRGQTAPHPGAPAPAAPQPSNAGGLPFQRPQAPAQQAPAQQAPAQAASPQAPAQAAAGARAPSPRLSIEQLAWLQAQVESSAELGRKAREQLGLTEADYASERAFWQVRFQQDRATVERYSQLFYHYRRGR